MKNLKKEDPNLYGEYDQDVPGDSDQTKDSSCQQDEHYLRFCVWAP